MAALDIWPWVRVYHCRLRHAIMLVHPRLDVHQPEVLLRLRSRVSLWLPSQGTRCSMTDTQPLIHTARYFESQLPTLVSAVASPVSQSTLSI
ncbi:hypothetical protein CONPUDRAFT_80230 [Coniophora puteana RWD-64-598 SS2]|uniref:Uncharacterized protein n=1 Tax=Coniophora puteana (strain RWD-64-598) TaxID=741705 RepID=A0A5M3N4K6_CONPW|nr:uncharacterized protein CONPUDRAFT_80230 [Coniophora puteana RWD-64-598 SS2]EIW85841.1 hypothetical protein CONPUDRAFT_80230 [Coniophora puteana RWD-64-598 SS2]